MLLLVLSGFALRLHGLTRQDIWWDEARNIDVALRPLIQVAVAPELDIHPPLYFWLLHGWGRLLGLGNSIGVNLVQLAPPVQVAFSMRFFSVAAGVVSIALLAQLARRSAPAFLNRQIAGVSAAALGALAPFWLAESQETRMYTVAMALLLAAALAFLAALDRFANERPSERNTRYSLLAFIFFSTLALLTHYNALFVVAAWYVWWGVWALGWPDRWRQLRVVILCGLATTALLLPIAPIALRQIPGYANPNLTIPTLGDYLWQNWQTHLGGYAWNAQLLTVRNQLVGNLWLWMVLFLLGGGFTLAYWRWNVGDRRQETEDSRHASRITHHVSLNTHYSLLPLSFLLVWLLGGLGLYYIAVLDRGAFNPRYAGFVTPALYALCGVIVAAWSRLWAPLGLVSGAILLAGVVPASHADLTDPRFAREDVAGVAEWLRTSTRTGDVILVDQRYPFGFYYEGYANHPEANAEPIWDEGAPAYYLFVDINTVDHRLTEWAGAAQRVFWVRWFESDTDPRRAVTFLLDTAGERAGEKDFHGYSIDWWELTPPNRFDLTENLTPATHIFPPAVETVDVALPPEPIVAGEPIPLVLRWKLVTEGRTDRPLKARLALYEPGATRILGQDDRPILNDRHLLPAEWSKMDRPLNVYTVPTPPDLAPGPYEVRLLVYDAETLAPLTYVDLAGNPAGIEAILGTVQMTNDE